MSRTVFILGAGASHEAGGPLMADFLETAERLYRQKEVVDHAPAFELVFKGRMALSAVQIKAVLNLFNIENVYGAFEMAGLVGRLGNLKPEEVKGLGPAMRRLIATTLERTIRYPTEGEKRLPVPPEPYGLFAKAVKELNSSAVGPVSVITFNYDVGLDSAFHFRAMGIDYSLSEGEGPAGVPVLKPHGSLNWTTCQKCGTVCVLKLSEFFGTHYWLPGRKALKRADRGIA